MREIKRNGKKFGLTMFAAFGVFAVLSWCLQRNQTFVALGLAALAFASLALAKPAWLEPIEAKWMALARLLGVVNTTIIMGILYVTFIVPANLILGMFGRDIMRRRWPAGANSGWEDYRSHQSDQRHYEKMF